MIRACSPTTILRLKLFFPPIVSLCVCVLARVWMFLFPVCVFVVFVRCNALSAVGCPFFVKFLSTLKLPLNVCMEKKSERERDGEASARMKPATLCPLAWHCTLGQYIQCKQTNIHSSILFTLSAFAHTHTPMQQKYILKYRMSKYGTLTHTHTQSHTHCVFCFRFARWIHRNIYVTVWTVHAELCCYMVFVSPLRYIHAIDSPVPHRAKLCKCKCIALA